ncbi:hypothetical protein D3C86_899690 [compost metagenome]
MAVQQGDVQMLAQAAAVALLQGRQHRDGGIHAGDDIGDRHARLLRPAAGQVIAFAGDAHQAAHALDHEVVAGALRERAVLAEAGDRAIDQARVDVLQALVIQPVLGQPAHLEVLDQDVADRGQFADQRRAFRRGHVRFDRTLVAVGAKVIGGFVGVLAVAVLQEGRAPGARVVAHPRAFDLDDIGAQVGQVLRAPRAGQDARQVQYTDAIQRRRARHDCTVAVPWLMTTMPRSLARAMKRIWPSGVRHMSHCRVSPGYTGAEKRVFKLVRRLAS